MKTFFLVTLCCVSLFAEEYYNRGKLTTLTQTTAPESSKYRSSRSIQWFRTETGQIVGTTDQIIVQFKNPENAQEILNSLKINRFEWLTKTMIVLTTPLDADIFVLSRTLAEQKEVEFAQPDFYTERGLR